MPGSSGSVKSDELEMSCAVGGSGSGERSQLWCFPVLASMKGGSYKLKETQSRVRCGAYF